MGKVNVLKRTSGNCTGYIDAQARCDRLERQENATRNPAKDPLLEDELSYAGNADAHDIDDLAA